MFKTLRNAWKIPDLRNKLLFTMMILLLYRFGAVLPVPFINAEAMVGKMAIINTMALVEHECVVEDFAHVAVAAVLCGQVHVGKAAFIGANATVIQGRKIESGQIVPAGATIR